VQDWGFDMSNALGIGVEPDLLVKAAHRLGVGDPDWAKIYALAAVDPGITGSGILPVSLWPGVSVLQNTLKNLNRVENLSDLLALTVTGRRMLQFFSALREGPVYGIATRYERTPEGEIELRARSGYFYPIRRPPADIYTDEIISLVTGTELLLRTFGPIPITEKLQYKAQRFKKIIDDATRKLSADITEDLLSAAGKLSKNPRDVTALDNIARARVNILKLMRFGKVYDEGLLTERQKKVMFLDPIKQAEELIMLELKQNLDYSGHIKQLEDAITQSIFETVRKLKEERQKR